MGKMSLRIAVAVAALCFFGIAAEAQLGVAAITGVTVDPPYPSSHEAVKLTVAGQGPLCTLLPIGATVTNAPDFLSTGTIKLRIVACPVDPPPVNVPFAETVAVGPLPEGSYDVQTEDGLFTARITVRDFPPQRPVNSLFLDNQRFEVHVTWRTATASGVGFPEALTDNSGYFWFFDATNPELLVKVIDGRAVNGHFWVFLGGLSDVDYTVTITQAITNEVRTYTNPHGTVASRADTTAFADPLEP